ncbi:MAG: SO_0444 family Cu/Zn efflux transporter [Candidatus Sedimenticola sp. 20ELBAFRAG]
MIESFFLNTLDLALESAPWLVLGLLAAGLIRAWLPMDLVARSMGDSGLKSVSRAALIGAPLPLCSCGTLPAAFSLRRSGASKASTTSFLIATPETGVDSVALSWVLLGPLMAVLRPVAAIISAIAAGLLVGRTEGEAVAPANGVTMDVPISIQVETCSADGDCGCEVESPSGDFTERAREGVVYAFTDLLDDLTLWLLIGILVAGGVLTLVPPDTLAEWGSGLLPMLLIMLISVPMYVCATASTPIAHAMLFAGVSPGTVLVFLLAGPASNLAGLALVKRELGQKALFAYLFGVGGMSILLGLGLDYAVELFALQPLVDTSRGFASEHDSHAILPVVSLLLLAVTGIRPLRHLLGRIGSREGQS